jgi:hypothetical protein
MAGHITNDGCADADHGDGNDEARVAIGQTWVFYNKRVDTI